MILPIRTSISPRRTPYTNYVLIVLNAAIFLLTYSPHIIRLGTHVIEEPLRLWAQQFMLTPTQPQIWQFVSYAFLHGSWEHIIFNMFFLYLFGNNVNDKLGNIGYTCFFLAGAVFSGIGHSFLSNAPVLGASGAVAAVTGAYLVLFPKTLVTILYWFIFIGTIDVSAIYFIGLKMILIDNIVVRSTPYVAYDAHLSGYTFGVIAMMLLLLTGLLGQSHSDLIATLRQMNRRRRYRDVTTDGYDPFKGAVRAKPVTSTEPKDSREKELHEEKILQFRNEVAAHINQRNLPQAANLYIELVYLDKENVLPERHQLDIANQLMSDGNFAQSAQAYEKFLNHYSKYEFIEQVQLMLGVLYSRYLNQPQKARQHLEKTRQKLSDPGQIQMCEDELAKLDKS